MGIFCVCSYLSVKIGRRFFYDIINKQDNITMKKFVMALALCLISAATSYAAENDTVAFNISRIQKVVADTTINNSGKQSIKWYFIVENKLINTTKTTIEKVRLAKKFGVDCNIVAIKNKQTNVIKKIVAL